MGPMNWTIGGVEIRRFIDIAIWIGVLALMAKRFQTKRQTLISMVIWAVLLVSGVVLVRLLN